MRLSRETRYAIEALLVLAEHEPGVAMGAGRIAEEAGLPPAYLQKILRPLARAGVVHAARGRGFSLARPASEISMREVLNAVEGGDVFGDRCIFWREECSESEPCELHFRWKELRPVVETTIANTTLEDVRQRGVPAVDARIRIDAGI